MVVAVAMAVAVGGLKENEKSTREEQRNPRRVCLSLWFGRRRHSTVILRAEVGGTLLEIVEVVLALVEALMGRGGCVGKVWA